MDILKILDTSDIVNLLSGNYMEVISNYLAVAAMPILVIALINCFFGQKLFKILVGIAGIFIGAGLGAGISIGFSLLVKKDMPNTSMIIISVILGILIFGFISFKLYKAGAFCMGFLSGVVLGVSVMKLLNKDDYLIAAVIGGLLMGLLAIDLYKHMVIILTSVNGGLIGAACIAIITKNDSPVYMLKLGIGLAIGGIIFQYILSLFGKKKDKDEEDEDDEEVEDEKQDKRKKADKRITKTKQRKNVKQRANLDEKKAKKKANKKSDKNANKKEAAIKKKEAAIKKKENNGAGFFLIDIIIEVAQGIKDRVVRYLNADDIEDDEDDEYEYDDNEEDDEDEDNEDDEEDYDEEEDDNQDYDEIEEDEYAKYSEIDEEEVEDNANEDMSTHQYDIASLKEKVQEKEKKIIIKENEGIDDLFQDMEYKLTRNLEENINIPLFDIDEIGAKLEAELDNNLKIQMEEELENLIIKQTIKEIDL